MPRIKEYDRQDVVAKAAGVFYGRGFEATSMSDLVAATRLNTASMYKEFGSKEGLYEAALDQYREGHIRSLLIEMDENPSLAALKGYLDQLEAYASSEGFAGCLLMNNLAEVDVVPEGAVSRVKALCRDLESVFEKCLQQAKRDGELAAEKDPEQMARLLSCFVHGVVLYGRMEESKPKLAGLFQQIWTVIEG